MGCRIVASVSDPHKFFMRIRDSENVHTDPGGGGRADLNPKQ